jgi:thiol-disulfide isomerase/thioredoxin
MILSSSFRTTQRDIIDPDGLKIPVLNFQEFQEYYQDTSDTTYVINFWATWCKPCVAELGEFEKLSDSADSITRVILVSLDFKVNWDSGLVKFIKERKLKSDVVVLYDTDADKWIPQVNEHWTGAIPATLIVKKENTWFHEGSVTYDTLKHEILNLNTQ